MIHIDAVWLSTVPLDMRAGTDTTLARVVADAACLTGSRGGAINTRSSVQRQCMTRLIYIASSSACDVMPSLR